MNLALTQIELDITAAGGCQDPRCKDPLCAGPLRLLARCHPGRGVDAVYTKGEGVMRLVCHVCHRPIAAVKVAES